MMLMEKEFMITTYFCLLRHFVCFIPFMICDFNLAIDFVVSLEIQLENCSARPLRKERIDEVFPSP